MHVVNTCQFKNPFFLLALGNKTTQMILTMPIRTFHTMTVFLIITLSVQKMCSLDIPVPFTRVPGNIKMHVEKVQKNTTYTQRTFCDLETFPRGLTLTKQDTRNY